MCCEFAGGFWLVASGVAFVSLAILLPGLALQRVARVPLDWAQVVPLGATFCAASWWASLWLGAWWVFPLALTGAAFAGLRAGGRKVEASQPSLRGAVPPALVMGAILLLARSGDVGAQGGGYRVGGMSAHDDAIHVALAWEFQSEAVPQVPGFAGRRFGYHMGPDLIRAAAVRFTGLSPYQTLTQVEPFVALAGLILALRAAAHRLGLSPLAVTLMPWTLLGGDFSYLLAAGSGVSLWQDLSRTTLVWDWVIGNSGLILALSATLAALVSLSRWLESRERGFLILASVLAVAVPWLKLFTGVQLLGAIVVAALASPRNRKPLFGVALLGGLSAGALIAMSLGQRVAVSWSPLIPVQRAAALLDLPPSIGGRWDFSLFFLVCALGVRIFGLVPALRSLVGGSPLAAGLAFLALSGWPVWLCTRIGLTDSLPVHWGRLENETFYFSQFSGAVLWIFTIQALVEWKVKQPGLRSLALWGAALVSLPSTAEWLQQKAATPPTVFEPAAMKAMTVLAGEARRGDILLQPPDESGTPPPGVVFLGLRVPYSGFFTNLSRFDTPVVIKERRHEVGEFFRTRDPDAARETLKHLGVSWVYSSSRPLKFDASGILAPVFEQGEVRLYRVLP